MPSISLGREPTIIIQAIVLVLNAVQIAALNLPTVAHTIIAIVLVILGALLTRSQVSPKAPAPVPPVTPAA